MPSVNEQTEARGGADMLEELAYREADGIEVALLWARGDGRLEVVCSDTRTGDAFTITPEPANALDVFYHPYAYAGRAAA
jgi:hypothetical protein